MKAIQTRHNGFFYRSRLEARWSVFFTGMGLDVEYEPEGFRLPSGSNYLPDFRYVSPQGYCFWYEVKPKHETENSKFSEFAHNSSETSILLSGDPVGFLQSGGSVCPRCGGLIEKNLMSIQEYYCHPYDMDTPCGGDNPYEISPLGNICKPHKGVVEVDAHTESRWQRRIRSAALSAREARFESNAEN